MEITEMPKDARLYMTFPNDFHRHPKIRRLSVDARWAFVVLNGEARIEDNDGAFDVVDAVFLLADHVDDPQAVVQELANSHPTRPLVVVDGDTLRIRDYAEHQQTKAEREALSAKRAAAGAAGGRARSKGQASAKQNEAAPSRDRDRDTSPNGEVVHAQGGDDIESAGDVEFERVWAAWPRKNDRKTAHRRWTSLSARKRAEILPLVLEHAEAHRAHTPAQFVPYLSTWLNRERWTDTLPTSRSTTQADKNAEVLGRYV
jgi:hypothetical protein